MLLREPDVPVGEADESDSKFQKQVEGFNKWIELIKDLSKSHIIRMNPILEERILGIMRRTQPLE